MVTTTLTVMEETLKNLNKLSSEITDSEQSRILLQAIIILSDIVRVIKEEVTLELLVRTKKGGQGA